MTRAVKSAALLIAGVILIAGCMPSQSGTGPDPMRMAADMYQFNVVGFSAADTAVLQAAADDWCAASEGRLCATVGNLPTAKSSIVLRTDTPPAAEGGVSAGGVYNRPYCQDHINPPSDGMRIDIYPGAHDARLHLLLLHELGHLFGADHSADPNDVMYPNDAIGPHGLTGNDISAAACPWLQ